jgi:hypothetical protein
MAKTLITLAILIVGFIAIVEFGADHAGSEPPHLSQQQTADTLEAARYGCEQWTRSHSKLAVTEVIGTSAVAEHNLPSHVTATIEYRAGASGILMHARCAYQDNGKTLTLISAKTSL